MKFAKVKDVKTPKRANNTDAGIDFFVPETAGTITLTPGDSCLIASGIKVNVPEGYALVAFNKFQFELIETLYLRLGFNMMVEWGNSHYLPNKQLENEDQTIIEQVGNTVIENNWFQNHLNILFLFYHYHIEL